MFSAPCFNPDIDSSTIFTSATLPLEISLISPKFEGSFCVVEDLPQALAVDARMPGSENETKNPRWKTIFINSNEKENF